MKLNIVPARAGAQWVRSGLQTFAKRPLAFMVLFMLSMTVVSLISRLPLLGPLLTLALLPATTLGFMAAAEYASSLEARPQAAGIFLAAFRAVRTDIRPLAVLGALYAVLIPVVVGASAVIDGGQFARVYLLGEPVSRELAQSGAFQAAGWLAMLLYLPLSLTFWHAPALIHWHHVPPVKSLFFSFVACLKTFKALLVFMLVWLGVLAGAGILLSAVSLLLGAVGLFGSDGAGVESVVGLLVMGGATVTATMFFTSLWFSFHNTFESE